jgi:hypothetical protein
MGMKIYPPAWTKGHAVRPGLKSGVQERIEGLYAELQAAFPEGDIVIDEVSGKFIIKLSDGTEWMVCHPDEIRATTDDYEWSIARFGADWELIQQVTMDASTPPSEVIAKLRELLA